MFENMRDAPADPWLAPIARTASLFRHQIRSRQIQAYKASIRHRYLPVLNYADPASTLRNIKLAIAGGQSGLGYVQVHLSR